MFQNPFNINSEWSILNNHLANPFNPFHPRLNVSNPFYVIATCLLKQVLVQFIYPSHGNHLNIETLLGQTFVVVLGNDDLFKA